MKLKMRVPYKAGQTKHSAKVLKMLKGMKRRKDPFIEGITRRGEMAKQNVDTARKVQEVLAQLNTKAFTVLATYEASKGKPHEIRLLANSMVICTGKCWQYSKDGTCKHLKHFKANSVVQKFGRIEKQK